jgi:hypothetical protein
VVNKERNIQMQRKKIKVKITSYGKITAFGYNIRTPAYLELYPNQIAILKSSGVKIEEIPDKK